MDNTQSQIKIPLWVIFLFISVAQSSELIFSAGLTNLADELKLKTNIVQLCSAFYYCGVVIGIFFFGRMSDLYGRRRMLLYGVAIYVVFSFAIFLVNNIYILIICRIFQAFGISSCSIIPQTVARDCYKGAQLAKIYSVISIIICFIPVFASSIGGFIVENYSWRYNVILLTFLGLILSFVCYCFLPETIDYNIVDRISSFTSVIKTMINDKNVIIYSIMSGCSIAILMSFVIEFSITFIKYFQMRPSIYGMLNVFVSISMFIGTILNIYLIAIKCNYRNIILFGLIMSIIGCSLMLSIGFLHCLVGLPMIWQMSLMIIARMLQGVGHIMMMPYVLSRALQSYQSNIGSASSIFNATYTLIVTVVIFILSFLHSDINIYGFAILIFIISLLNFWIFRQLAES